MHVLGTNGQVADNIAPRLFAHSDHGIDAWYRRAKPDPVNCEIQRRARGRANIRNDIMDCDNSTRSSEHQGCRPSWIVHEGQSPLTSRPRDLQLADRQQTREPSGAAHADDAASTGRVSRVEHRQIDPASTETIPQLDGVSADATGRPIESVRHQTNGTDHRWNPVFGLAWWICAVPLS
jgi:hypothetical protein